MADLAFLPNIGAISPVIPGIGNLAEKILGKGSGTSLGGFVVEVTISETHTKKSTATSNPVETGYIVSDHIDIEPDELTISGCVSNTPLNLNSSLTGLAASGGAIVGKLIGGGLGGAIGATAAGAIVGLLTGSNNRVQDSYDHLKNLRDARVPFTAITGYERYDNMVLETLTCTRDAKTGQVLDFTATMKQIIIVQSKTVTVPNVRGGTNGAGSKSDLGKQNGQTPANNDTIALTLTKGIKGLFQ